MALRAKLELRQGQSLVMTPQLQQAIKLLQMSNLELAEFIQAELERNPLLEISESDDQKVPSEDASQPTPLQERLEQLDSDLDNVYADEAVADRQARDTASAGADSGWSTIGPGSGHAELLDSDIEGRLRQDTNLREYLEHQLGEISADPIERFVGSYLIGMLDESGYFTADLAETATQLGVDRGVVEACLAKIQGMDPPGIAARNLKECLSIQLETLGHLTLEMEALLDNLPLVAKRDFTTLQKICEVDADELRSMIAKVRQMNPKPAFGFEDMAVQTVIPDVFVHAAPDGNWIVELNTSTLPRVLVDNRYYAEVSRRGREQDREYLSECLTNANWLVKSMEQRARTILRVAREIVRQQDAFLVHGVQFLRPLNLRTVADAIEMHESTVSRVTANKYMATPRGTFEMKYFFTTAIAAVDGGETYSAEAVRHRIKELVDNEPPDSVLSDDRIVELLRDSGIDIARRTVAKYREALGISSSVQRRREKQNL